MRAAAGVPAGWAGLLWLWNTRTVRRVRLAASLAGASMRLPAVVALIAGALQGAAPLAASGVSLPMLAPLLIGVPVLLRAMVREKRKSGESEGGNHTRPAFFPTTPHHPHSTQAANASLILPRATAAALCVWSAWLAHKLVASGVRAATRAGRLPPRTAAGLTTASEVACLGLAALALLSACGLHLSLGGLLLPLVAAAAVASFDALRSLGAGAFLLFSAPFNIGDTLAVSTRAAGGGGDADGWWVGRVEYHDLRFAVIRAQPADSAAAAPAPGSPEPRGARLFVPNAAFLSREFVVYDRPPPPPPPPVTRRRPLPPATAWLDDGATPVARV